MTIVRSKLFVLVLSFLLVFTAQGQVTADSLKTLLSSAANDTIYVDILNELSKIYKQSDPLVSLDYAVKAQKTAQLCSYNEGQALAYFNIANLYARKGNNELAIENYTNSLKLYQGLNNKSSIAEAYSKIGLIYRYLLQYEKALDFHNKSLSIKKDLHDSLGIAIENENIGLIYLAQYKYDKALISLYNSLRLKESLNDKFGMAHTYENIGLIYYLIESFDQAQVNFERSLMLYEQTQDNIGISNSLLYLGDIYAHQNSQIRALEVLSQSLDLNKKSGNFDGMAQAYLKIGKIYVSIQKPYLAYDNFINSLNYFEKIQNEKGIILSRQALANYYYSFNDFENAHAQLLKALILAQKLSYLKEEYELLKLLAEIYIKEENYYKTSTTLVRANLLSDSLWEEKLRREISQLKMQFEFDRRMQLQDMDTLRLNNYQDLKSQKASLIKNMAFVLLILLIIFGFILYKKSLSSKKKDKIIAEQIKSIEAQMAMFSQQKIELENALHTKNKFLSIIGNDLRNPFNTINSFIAQITDPSLNLDDTTISKYLLLIKEAGADSMNLLENLMEWAKIQSGELTVLKEDVQLNYILRGNILFIKEMARQKNVEIIEELVAKPRVTVDKNMINTVVRNLLSNALKFTNSGGTIWIKTIINNDEIKIVVQDSGVGIKEDILSTIFEPAVIKKGLNGIPSSGLGLVLCKELLHRHRQELRVDSKLDFGTTFWFYLPLSE